MLGSSTVTAPYPFGQQRQEPFYPNKMSSMGKCMKVIFVPMEVYEIKKMSGVKTIHELFSECKEGERVSLMDRAYLFAFNRMTSQALGLDRFGHEDALPMSWCSQAEKLSYDKALKAKINQAYFHQYSPIEPTNGDCSPANCGFECHDTLECTTNYVVIEPGQLTVEFEPGNAPPVSERLSNALDQWLNVLRRCIKPFSHNNTKESIAMGDPSGTYSAYLSLLGAA